MIAYGQVEIEKMDEFWINGIGNDGPHLFDREELTALRDAIDQALNTSAEELEASGE